MPLLQVWWWPLWHDPGIAHTNLLSSSSIASACNQLNLTYMGILLLLQLTIIFLCPPQLALSGTLVRTPSPQCVQIAPWCSDCGLSHLDFCINCICCFAISKHPERSHAFLQRREGKFSATILPHIEVFIRLLHAFHYPARTSSCSSGSDDERKFHGMLEPLWSSPCTEGV